jgi:hypothetical protein
MSIAEVKRALIQKIKKSKDESFLKDVYSLLKDESKSEMLLLSNEQVLAILEGELEISNGQYLTDASVRKRTSQWLGK